MKFKRNQKLILVSPLSAGEEVKYVKKHPSACGNPAPRPFYIIVKQACGHRMLIDYRHTEEGRGNEG